MSVLVRDYAKDCIEICKKEVGSTHLVYLYDTHAIGKVQEDLKLPAVDARLSLEKDKIDFKFFKYMHIFMFDDFQCAEILDILANGKYKDITDKDELHQKMTYELLGYTSYIFEQNVFFKHIAFFSEYKEKYYCAVVYEDESNIDFMNNVMATLWFLKLQFSLINKDSNR